MFSSGKGDKMNEGEWEQFWAWLKKNFQHESGGHYQEILEDIRQLYEGNTTLREIGVSKYFLVDDVILSTKVSKEAEE